MRFACMAKEIKMESFSLQCKVQCMQSGWCIFLAQWVAAAAQAANGVAETMISLPLSQMKTTKFFPWESQCLSLQNPWFYFWFTRANFDFQHSTDGGHWSRISTLVLGGPLVELTTNIKAKGKINLCRGSVVNIQQNMQRNELQSILYEAARYLAVTLFPLNHGNFNLY